MGEEKWQTFKPPGSYIMALARDSPFLHSSFFIRRKAPNPLALRANPHVGITYSCAGKGNEIVTEYLRTHPARTVESKTGH